MIQKTNGKNNGKAAAVLSPENPPDGTGVPPALIDAAVAKAKGKQSTQTPPAAPPANGSPPEVAKAPVDEFDAGLEATVVQAKNLIGNLKLELQQLEDLKIEKTTSLHRVEGELNMAMEIQKRLQLATAK